MANPFQPWKPNMNATDFYQKPSNEICDSSNLVANFVSYPSSASTSSNIVSMGGPVAGQSTSSENFANKSAVAKLVNSENCNKFGFDLNFLNGSSSGAVDEGGKMEEMISNAIGDHAKQQILKILENISYLKPPEKLLLYLRLPGGYPETDPLRQSQNPLGTRSEINHTINWVRSHLEVDPSVSIPKQDVYEDYVAYCSRCDIKPLSTADFGKVMKQVFPGIRPRRLGTRGNSRYCYAAMRKATKLDAPKLPELNTKKYAEISNAVVTSDECAWKTIKNWAETLLDGAFDNMSDLADHITENNLCSLANNKSRQLLKKKIMQREAKDKRVTGKNGNDAAIKRRRKKRRKTLSTSLISSTTESQLQHSSNVDNLSGDSCSQPPSNKTEDSGGGGGDFDTSVYHADRKNALKSLLVRDSQQQQQQMLPINLITNHTTTNNINNNSSNNNFNNKLKTSDSVQVMMMQQPSAAATATATTNGNKNEKCLRPNSDDNLIINSNNLTTTTTIHGTNLVCDKNGVLNGDNRQQQVVAAASLGMASDSSNNNNISLHDAEMQQIFCKKVRQAQQAKGRWLNLHENGGLITRDQVSTTTITKIGDLLEDKEHQPQSPSKTLMMMPRVPPKRRGGSSLNSAAGQRLKKQKAGTSNNPEAVLNAIKPSDLVVKRDDIRGECIIPRERFISICNMDKDALDSYLVGEDNSQEQEAELLQIFQQPDGQSGAQQKSNSSSVSCDELEAAAALDNFSMYGECKQEKLSDGDEAEGKLMQLRNLLEHNLTNSKKVEMSTSGAGDDNQLNLFPGSASASLAMLVQRHNMPASASNTPYKNRSMPTTPNLGSAARKLNVDGPFGGASAAPPTLSSARTFVPIAADRMQLAKNQTMNTNIFASPRATPVVRRMQRNFGTLSNNLPTLNMPQNNHCNGRKVAIGAQNTAFSRPQQLKNEFPVSAPPSPSPMMSGGYQRFSNNLQYSPGGNPMPAMQNQQQQQQQLHQSWHQPQAMADLSSLECRSQSVPLHCRSPNPFNQNAANFNYSAYSSANNSVSQTPVPSEYNDFNETSLLDMFAEQELPTNTTKIEAADVISELLEEEDDDTNYFGLHSRTNFNTSRSVPATPLPHFGTNATNSFDFTSGGGGGSNTKTSNYLYDASKSVPTTPIQHHQPHNQRFRFSPELSRDVVNRDFLINGNSVEQGKFSTNYFAGQGGGQQQASASQSSTIGSIVDKELSRISDDIDFSSDPIIGNEILNFK